MNQAPSRIRVQQILEACRSLKIAVLGDFALDAYWYIDMAQAQLSREAPLYNRPVVKESYSLGGSANVAWNLADLGVTNVKALSVMGEDWRATLLRDLMMKPGIQSDGCVSSSQWSTVLFAKIILIAGSLQQEDSRIDFINEHPLTAALESALLERLDACLPGLDALVISDYQVNGVISAGMLKNLNLLAERHSDTLFLVDSRERVGQYRNMVLKPNLLEVLRAVKIDIDPDLASEKERIQAGRSLQVKAKKPVFITLGERGCLVVDAGSSEHVPAPRILPPIDTVGAGDTFLAALAACLAAGASHIEAASIACLASAVTVRKLNVTGTATPAEILALFDEFDPAVT